MAVAQIVAKDKKEPLKKGPAPAEKAGPIPPLTPEIAAAAPNEPLGMKFVKVPRGTFWMRWVSEKRQSKQVTITADFEMAAYTVTQAQWQHVTCGNGVRIYTMGQAPTGWSGAAAGTLMARAAGRPTASASRRPTGTTSWVSGLPEVRMAVEQAVTA